MIIGNACSGKTTLARELHLHLGIEVYHLDSIIWQPGFQVTPLDIRQKEISQIINRPEWIIEGVSYLAAKKADVLIFLDISRPILLLRGALRTLKHIKKQRAELPENCQDWKVFHLLMKTIWKFQSNFRPKILEITLSRKNVFHYRKNISVSQILQNI